MLGIGVLSEFYLGSEDILPEASVGMSYGLEGLVCASTYAEDGSLEEAKRWVQGYGGVVRKVGAWAHR